MDEQTFWSSIARGAEPEWHGQDNIFREWQPRYAARGIATFPVRIDGKNKRPAIRGWRKIGLRGSAQVALKIEANAIGFNCGSANAITVADLDSRDASIITKAEEIFGSSFVLWRTGSGKFAAPYRYNGEKRRIRPLDDLPIDVLGDGGFAVLPPSAGAKCDYEIIRGSLDDLANLPPMRGDPLKVPPAALLPGGALIPNGRRNATLFKRLLREALYCDDFNAILDTARSINMTCQAPLPDSEVIRIAASVWKLETSGKNWVGRKARASTDREEILALSRFPAAGLLLCLLRCSHPTPGDRFAISQMEVAELLTWDRNTVRTAIKTLIAANKVRRVHYGKGKGDPHLYQFALAASAAPDRG